MEKNMIKFDYLFVYGEYSVPEGSTLNEPLQQEESENDVFWGEVVVLGLRSHQCHDSQLQHRPHIKRKNLFLKEPWKIVYKSTYITLFWS